MIHKLSSAILLPWSITRCGRHLSSFQKHSSKLALFDRNGPFTYGDLNLHSDSLLNQMRNRITDLKGKRIAYLCPHDASYLITQTAVWRGRGIAVPLSSKHPPEMLSYFLRDSDTGLLVIHEDNTDILNHPDLSNIRTPTHVIRRDECLPGVSSANDQIDIKAGINDPEDPALIVYTSGTTGPPKVSRISTLFHSVFSSQGVVQTHRSLNAMVSDQVTAWEWTADDVILHVLPLHHVHGIINSLLVPLGVGATCVMMEKFTPNEAWELLLSKHQWSSNCPSPNVFMAVPTVYAKLLENIPISHDIRAVLEKNFRLMVSGSASLPQPIMEEWERVSGHHLLERYGMTETGMVLTNPLHDQRIPGAVGQPFPSVRVSIAETSAGSNRTQHLALGDYYGTNVSEEAKGIYSSKNQLQSLHVHHSATGTIEGELLVKGPTLFKEYWGKESASLEAFTKDGWFKTGDTASYSDGVYRIMGRTSVDIIKSGGYKISALDIERHILAHPHIADCAVVGLPDLVYGQQVAAVVVFADAADPFELSDLKEWLSDKLAPYQVPRVLKVLPSLPRSLIGKVNKKQLVKEVFNDS